MLNLTLRRELIENAVIILSILALDYCLNGPFSRAIHILIR